MLPFVIYDAHMFPAGASAVANAVHQAGFTRTRAVFQLWNPRFKASRARIDGRPLEMLLVSSMQIHSRRAYEAIGDAYALGPERPLIIAGGPKAVYEPYHFWPEPGQLRAGRRTTRVRGTPGLRVLLILKPKNIAARGRACISFSRELLAICWSHPNAE